MQDYFGGSSIYNNQLFIFGRSDVSNKTIYTIDLDNFKNSTFNENSWDISVWNDTASGIDIGQIIGQRYGTTIDNIWYFMDCEDTVNKLFRYDLDKQNEINISQYEYQFPDTEITDGMCM